jgi:hypothetical protein
MPTVTRSANATAIVTGVLLLYYRVGLGELSNTSLEILYHSIALSLNLLLTLMIIARLALHSRNIRNAIGASSGAGGLYTALITMLVESSALYAICYLLYMIPTAAGSYVGYIFSPVLGQVQVRAAFTFPRRITIFERHFLIMEVNRSLLRSSSFCESQTGVR